jgi:hypothetical protein
MKPKLQEIQKKNTTDSVFRERGIKEETFKNVKEIKS